MAEWLGLAGSDLTAYAVIAVILVIGVGTIWAAALAWVRDNEFGWGGTVLCLTGAACIALTVLGPGVVIRRAPPPETGAVLARIAGTIETVARRQEDLQVALGTLDEALRQAVKPAEPPPPPPPPVEQRATPSAVPPAAPPAAVPGPDILYPVTRAPADSAPADGAQADGVQADGVQADGARVDRTPAESASAESASASGAPADRPPANAAVADGAQADDGPDISDLLGRIEDDLAEPTDGTGAPAAPAP